MAQGTSDVPQRFGKVLRAQRIKRGFSQEGLALEASVDRTFVSKIERGINQPSLTTLFLLAQVLEVAPSELIKQTESAD